LPWLTDNLAPRPSSLSFQHIASHHSRLSLVILTLITHLFLAISNYYAIIISFLLSAVNPKL
ncbi:MAG: hypothetical protein JTJ28_01445, partial [Lactobacillus sp.]|nr:hypothetical protein [Lactobacillus sp.]